MQTISKPQIGNENLEQDICFMEYLHINVSQFTDWKSDALYKHSKHYVPNGERATSMPLNRHVSK